MTEAEAEYKIVSDAEAATPPDVIFQMPINNKAKDIMKIARDVLGAKIAMAKKDNSSAIVMLTRGRCHPGHAQVWRASRLVLSGSRIAGWRVADDRRRGCRGESVS